MINIGARRGLKLSEATQAHNTDITIMFSHKPAPDRTQNGVHVHCDQLQPPDSPHPVPVGQRLTNGLSCLRAIPVPSGGNMYLNSGDRPNQSEHFCIVLDCFSIFVTAQRIVWMGMTRMLDCALLPGGHQ